MRFRGRLTCCPGVEPRLVGGAMGRSVPKRSLSRRLIVVASLAVTAGCGDPPGPEVTPGYTIALNPTSASAAQGGDVAVQVTLTRNGGFTGTVALTLENAPAGVTGTFDPTPAPGASSTLTISVGGAATPGQYALTVRGAAPGLAHGTAALALTVTAPGAGSVTTVVAALAHSCALNAAGQPYCWGHNGGGNLGAPSTETCFESTPCSTRPVAVSGGLAFTTLSGFWVHTCGLTAGGDAYCWGSRNESGQLGDGTTTSRTVPTPVAGDLKSASISAGEGHTCGVTTSGAAYCWGGASASGKDNTEGQLGDGTTTRRLVPTPVAGGLSFAAVSAGVFHTCGITTSGAAYCWGFNKGGELGDGTTMQRLIPTPVAGDLTFMSISTNWRTCGVTTSGEAYCWGDNSNGLLGDGTTTGGLVPTPVAGSHRFTDVRTAEMHTCGVSTSGAALCWGRNQWGQLGDGTATARQVPTPVAGGHAFAAVSTGGSISAGAHTCGVTQGGLAYCWGANHYGQVGDGTTANGRVVPTPVAFP
jgi:alpha-tubulin suppressor-like RCC1 family protein